MTEHQEFYDSQVLPAASMVGPFEQCMTLTFCLIGSFQFALSGDPERIDPLGIMIIFAQTKS